MGRKTQGAVMVADLLLAIRCGAPSGCLRYVPLSRHWSMAVCASLFAGLLGCNESSSEASVELKPTDRAYLEGLVSELMPTLPSKIDKYSEITGVSVIPSGLRYDLRMIHMPAHTVDHGTLKSARMNLAERSCNDGKERFELEAGVSWHYIVHGMEDLPAGRFFISDAACRSE